MHLVEKRENLPSSCSSLWYDEVSLGYMPILGPLTITKGVWNNNWLK